MLVWVVWKIWIIVETHKISQLLSQLVTWQVVIDGDMDPPFDLQHSQLAMCRVARLFVSLVFSEKYRSEPKLWFKPLGMNLLQILDICLVASSGQIWSELLATCVWGQI